MLKYRPVGAELFHAYGRTDSDEANNRFLRFCERAHKKRGEVDHMCTMKTKWRGSVMSLLVL